MTKRRRYSLEQLLVGLSKQNEIDWGPPVGNEYNATDDFARSIDEAYRAIRERMRNGGLGWTQREYKRDAT